MKTARVKINEKRHLVAKWTTKKGDIVILDFGSSKFGRILDRAASWLT